MNSEQLHRGITRLIWSQVAGLDMKHCSDTAHLILELPQLVAADQLYRQVDRMRRAGRFVTPGVNLAMAASR